MVSLTVLLLKNASGSFALQTDPGQSQRLLKNSERFALLLAENLHVAGASLTIVSENIGKNLSYVCSNIILYDHFSHIVIVVTLVDPNNTTDVTFPGPNVSVDNSLSISASYIQQRSNETGKLPLMCDCNIM